MGDPVNGVEAEIVRHHEVIERWLTGALAREEFATFADAHGPGFTLSTPDGPTLSRDQVLAEVEALHGSAPGVTIEIRNVRIVASEGAFVVATYQEVQPDRTRQSTVVFQGTTWLHLHETWLP
ncbi:DUF4440 domain-containing protein [Streptosporangium jomthongense]|uniref:DUF4440 domain-containing protein n=1 Tax=Streptosporangium jomthongense TaxID=1193683 RepID=A0ABV8EXH8_9ACTN